jgi:adenylyltransferase/sulfurtransferase
MCIELITLHSYTSHSINPYITVISYPSHLTPDTAIPLITEYSIVLDCTDNPASRYLISDACVLANKPLVSASALRIDGQLMILNNPPEPPGDDGAPCYRCIFPRPPPPDSVLKCSDGGILGPVVGTMGVLQALETIKVITSWSKSPTPNSPPSLLIFSAMSSPPFRYVRLKPTRRLDCVVCSSNATVTADLITQGSLDYVQFCGVSSYEPLGTDKRITATEFARASKQGDQILIDVRDSTQFRICNLNGSINLPFSYFEAPNDELLQRVSPLLSSASKAAYVVCRLGNDSQDVVKRLEQLGFDSAHGWDIKDIIGGLKSWREEVDPEFPEY